MGWIKRVVVGRWLGKWLMRGGPFSIALKLLGVAAYGAWKWRREAKRVESDEAPGEIPADYEVVPDEPGELGSGGGRIPAPEEQGRRPPGIVEDDEPGSIRSDIEPSQP